jgi:hypothetical protein
MIGHASEWLAVGSIPFALSSGEIVVLCLIAALRYTPFEVELRISSLLSLRLRTEPTRDDAHVR